MACTGLTFCKLALVPTKEPAVELVELATGGLGAGRAVENAAGVHQLPCDLQAAARSELARVARPVALDVVERRAEAIAAAVGSLKAGDVLVVAGKGY